MKEIISAFIFIAWVAGVVLAKGFWSTAFALLVPFWSWYLVVEKIMQILKVT